MQDYQRLSEKERKDLAKSKEIDEKVKTYWETYQNLYKEGVLRSIGKYRTHCVIALIDT